MIAAWNAATAWLDAVPPVWFIIAIAALYAALTTAGRRTR